MCIRWNSSRWVEHVKLAEPGTGLQVIMDTLLFG